MTSWKSTIEVAVAYSMKNLRQDRMSPCWISNPRPPECEVSLLTSVFWIFYWLQMKYEYFAKVSDQLTINNMTSAQLW